MFDNVNEILLTVTVALGVLAVALRILIRTSRVEWVKRFMIWLLEYIDVGFSALVIALAVRSCVIEPFKIPSSSMEKTLLIGDHLFVNRFIYGQRVPKYFDRFFPSLKLSRPLAIREPRRGDIIVFVPPHQRDKDFIKRVVGIPGDRIEIRNQRLLVNGMEVDEPHVIHLDPLGFRGMVSRRDNMLEITVPPGKYFVMGDNRDRSADSRYWGYVSLRDIKGKAIFIYFSWNHDPDVSGFNPFMKIRWGRIGKGIH